MQAPKEASTSMRIVSLLPSGTEVVAALGLAGKMVARSHECDFPKEIVHLPPCTIPARGTSGLFHPPDSPPVSHEQRALSVFQVDWALLKAMRPTHVVTQTLCSHCAVSTDDVRHFMHEELQAGVELISFEALTLDGVVDENSASGHTLGEPEAARALSSGMRQRFAEARARCAAIPLESRPRVACLDWLDPLMLAGNWMPELIRLAGGVPSGGGDGVHSGWTQWEELAALDPDVIVAMPCGFPLSHTRDAVHRIAARAEWQALRAVRTGQVFLTDGSEFFNRPGPRLVDSLEILEEILGTNQAASKHRGIRWIQVPASPTATIAPSRRSSV